MSWTALAWAGKCDPGSASRKLVLFALADRHNDEENVAYPSIAWICAFTSLNRKTVIAALDALQGQGLIADSGLRVGKTGQIKAYSLALETVPKSEQSQNRNSSTFSRKESQKRDTEPVLNQCSEAKASSHKARERFPAPADVDGESWRDFLANRRSLKAPMSPTAYRRLCCKLDTLAADGWPPGEMIDLAVERGWKTVFAPQAESRKHDRQSSSRNTDAFQQFMSSP